MLDMQGWQKKQGSVVQVLDFSKLTLHRQKTKVFV